MESRLTRAIEAAEARKTAAFGDVVGVVEGQQQGRAVFSGFDIDFEQLTEVSNMAAMNFSGLASGIALGPLFSMAWTDGFLIGLLAASLPTTEGPESTGDSGPEVD